MTWRAHFLDIDLLSAEEVSRRFPNASRHLNNCAFVSHAGIDTPRVRRWIMPPVQEFYQARLQDRVFMHNAKSGGANDYRHLVLFALNLSALGLIVISTNSIGHLWVAAEVDWLIEHERPLALCKLDSTSPRQIDERLAITSDVSSQQIQLFDFTVSVEGAQALLGKWLSQTAGRARMSIPVAVRRREQIS
jgi:hypothetical protein